MNKKYEILPVKSRQVVPDSFKDIAEIGILPIHCFFLCIYAPPRQGKSSLIVNLLMNMNFNYKNRYDVVYYISPTLDADKTCNCIMKDDDIVKIHEPEDIDCIDLILNELLKKQKEMNKEEPYKALFVLDDMLGKLRDSEITKISSKYRHYNASFIIVSQSFKAISPIIRTCASHWIIFKTENQKEKMKIIEEFNGFKDFEKYLDEFTKEKYNFMYIDINKHSLHHNFTEAIEME